MKHILLALSLTLLAVVLIQADQSIQEQARGKILYAALIQNGISDSLIQQLLSYRRVPEPKLSGEVCCTGRYLYVSPDFETVFIIDYPDTCCYNIIPIYDQQDQKHGEQGK